jgi:hypothetical protein
LQQNPDFVKALQQYGRENLGQLSIEFMTEYVHGVVLPSMVAKEKNYLWMKYNKKKDIKQ